MRIDLDISSFKKKEINKMSNREAMGLPNFYRSCRIDYKELETAIKRLSGVRENILAEMIENPINDFHTRYASGLMLASLGDPRIDCYGPQMVKISSTKEVVIGLAKEKVYKVLDKYKHYGVIEEWILKETPEVSIQMKPFKMAKYPVTNGEFLEFLKDTKFTEIPTSWEFGIYL